MSEQIQQSELETLRADNERLKAALLKIVQLGLWYNSDHSVIDVIRRTAFEAIKDDPPPAATSEMLVTL